MGTEVAEVLKRRLADIRAATSYGDLIAGKPRLLNIGDLRILNVDLGEDYHLILEANHPQNPLTETGKLDWTRVSRVKVTHIGRNCG